MPSPDAYGAGTESHNLSGRVDRIEPRHQHDNPARDDEQQQDDRAGDRDPVHGEHEEPRGGVENPNRRTGVRCDIFVVENYPERMVGQRRERFGETKQNHQEWDKGSGCGSMAQFKRLYVQSLPLNCGPEGPQFSNLSSAT